MPHPPHEDDRRPPEGPDERCPAGGRDDGGPAGGPDDGEPTGWLGLDDDQVEAWVALASLIVALPAALDSRLRRDAGMRLVDFQVLSGLSLTPWRAAPMTVAAEMATISQSHMSRVAARLEVRGWLRRSPSPDDGRGTFAELTEEGRAAMTAAARAHGHQVQRLVFARLSPDRVRHLAVIAQRVLEAVRPGYCLRVPTADVVAARRPGGGPPPVWW